MHSILLRPERKLLVLLVLLEQLAVCMKLSLCIKGAQCTVKTGEEAIGLIGLVRAIGCLYEAFSVHHKGAQYTVKTGEEAIGLVKQCRRREYL